MQHNSRTSGVTGTIISNRKSSCYLTQEDYHQPYLSVIELMEMACSLKLKKGTDHEPIINEILKDLNLNHRRCNLASQLSGGERRRLSIALELVANPTIFYLDEPTSGLDEVTAAQCIRLLKNLAKLGKTVVCTIHQPSATTFALFDQIFVLARGQCVYQGGSNTLVPFLNRLNLRCPITYNPSDYIIELCDADDGRIVQALSNETQNGKLFCYISESDLISNQLADSLVEKSLQMKNALTAMILEKPKSKGGALLEKMKAFTKFMQNGTFCSIFLSNFFHFMLLMVLYTNIDHAVSKFRQFAVLFRIMMLKIVRNKSVLSIQLFHHVFCGVIFGEYTNTFISKCFSIRTKILCVFHFNVLGLIFFKAANDGERMFDHLKFCIGIIFFVAYTQTIVPILACKHSIKTNNSFIFLFADFDFPLLLCSIDPSEVKLLKKECFNRWYSLMPYYSALTLSRIPFQVKIVAICL